MIKVNNVTKMFETKKANDNILFDIPKGEIFGLLGTNGSGKSTLLRLICGIYKADDGIILVDGEDVWEHTHVKSKIFFVSDDIYFLPSATINSMANFYKGMYPNWSENRYNKLLEIFPLNKNKKISTFSKGMKRQAALILALSASPEYLLLDESFDGLDPVVRFAVRQLLSDMMSEYNMSIIISSHNLRELEDFCNYVALIHDGKLILTCSVDEFAERFCKAQIAFKDSFDKFPEIPVKILSESKKGSVFTIVCECSSEELIEIIEKMNPVLVDVMPLNLEEVFVYEMEAANYEYKNIIV